MATRNVGLRLKLDGEKEFKEAMSQLNAGSKTLAAEMRLLQAEFKGNADSMEFLTAKGDLLQRQLDQQQAKTAEVKKMVEAAADALEKAAQAQADAADKGADAQEAAAKAVADADKKLQEYTARLYDSEAAEANLRNEIEETTTALQGEGETMEGLGDTLDQLAGKFGINIPDGAKKALNGIEGLSAGTVAKMAVAAAAVAAVIKVLKELADMTIEVAAQVDEYITESAITGVSTEMLQAWDYAAPLIDTDAETIKGAMTKLTKAMGDARDGSDEAIEKFHDLGVTFENSDGSLRNAEEVFYDVIDALGEMESGTERDAAAMELLGKNAQDLNPLINAGSKSLKAYGEEAKNVGYILSNDQVAALGAVDDSYQKLQLTIDGVKKQVAADFAPAAQAAMELFSDAVQKAGEWLKKSGLIENIAAIVTSLMDILRTAGEILTGLPGFTNGLEGLKTVLGAIAQFVALIADAADMIKSLVTLDFSGLKNSLGFGYSTGNANNYQRTRMMQSGTWQEYQDFYSSPYYSGYTGNAGGSDNWKGGLTWVGEAGPELVNLPRGSQILSAQESRNMGGDTYYITIDAASVKEFNDIVEIARSARVRGRMG